MSYTMTIDVPEKVTSYVKRQVPRFYAEMNALLAAVCGLQAVAVGKGLW